MARDILNEYGRDSVTPQRPRATSGGVMSSRDVMGYRPPVGPIGINDPESPGLHGHNCGPAGTQGAKSYSDHHTSGRPGLEGATNHGNCGSQRG